MSDPKALDEFDNIKTKSWTRECALCARSDEPTLGPFCKVSEDKPSSVIGLPLYFHKDCLEVNKISRFNNKERTWVNIGTALNILVHKFPQKCFRCKTVGASIQCTSCPRWFHGHKCTELYCIALEKDLEYRCLFCCNRLNSETYREECKASKKGTLSPTGQLIK